ncbi:MAG TPA: PilZ domain-containing protein [Polyangia bacterium]|nr:PilZ domain-containing protein [Polyangia bacterium]
MQAPRGLEQRQHPRFGVGLSVTLLFGPSKHPVAGELQDISGGGCYFRSRVEVDIDRRIMVVLTDNSGTVFRATGRVVRTEAYQGFAVLFDDAGTRGVAGLVEGFADLGPEERMARLSTSLRPEIQVL